MAQRPAHDGARAASSGQKAGLRRAVRAQPFESILHPLPAPISEPPLGRVPYACRACVARRLPDADDIEWDTERLRFEIIRLITDAGTHPTHVFERYDINGDGK